MKTLILSIPAAVILWLWACSYFASHHVWRTHGVVLWSVVDGRGAMAWERMVLTNPTAEESASPVKWGYRRFEPARDVRLRDVGVAWTMWHRMGFGWQRYTLGWFEHRRLYLPYWVLILTAGVIPAYTAMQQVRRRRLIHRRRALSQCVDCGYDLRASSGRCPECGKAVPP